MKSDPPKEWLEANRRSWDARVPMHIGTPEYDMTALRNGTARLYSIEEALLGPLTGMRVLHLQCHFGRDTLVFAQRGAQVVGVDFSQPAVEAARRFAGEMGLARSATFFACDLYDAPKVVPDAGSFDIVFTSWGTIGWLPDMAGWANVIAHFLKPGGRFIFADAHPAALVLDDEKPEVDGRPGWYLPYTFEGTHHEDNPPDYTGDNPIVPGRVYEWMHPISSVVGALLDAGLRLDRLCEHDAVPWQMFDCLQKSADGLYRWPEEAWWPLSWSLVATRPRSVF